MLLVTTNVYTRNEKAYLDKFRLIINEGGTSSSKTYSIIQLLVLIAMYSKVPLLISVVSESYPHLRRGVIRDFRMIMGDDWNPNHWNKTNSEYDFGRTKIEFFGADDASKLRGGRRDILYVNEANNVTRMAFDELDVRTRICSFIDFNPVEQFWAHEMIGRPGVCHIHSTFLDAAQVLDKSVVDNILSRKETDPAWWRVYGLGLVGRIEGLVHPKILFVDELPKTGEVIYGLDFGYTNDPAVLVKSVIDGDSVFSRELFYQNNLTNQGIVRLFEQFGLRRGLDTIIADSAEPKSIDEIYSYGFDIRPCTKGPDSVNHGIQVLNQYRQFWTKDSLNAIKEQRNYRYKADKTGRLTNKPISTFNHAMDARRYSVVEVKQRGSSNAVFGLWDRAVRVWPPEGKPGSVFRTIGVTICNMEYETAALVWKFDKNEPLLWVCMEHMSRSRSAAVHAKNILKLVNGRIPPYQICNFPVSEKKADTAFGESMADQYAALGFSSLMQASSDLIDQISKVDTWIRRGWIAVSSSCERLNRQGRDWRFRSKAAPPSAMDCALVVALCCTIDVIYDSKEDRVDVVDKRFFERAERLDYSKISAPSGPSEADYFAV